MTKCVVCGSPTTQGPVCWDLRCEMERYGASEHDHTHDNDAYRPTPL
jgi:hypothetical protein